MATLVKLPTLTKTPTVYTLRHSLNSILAITPPTKRTAAISFQTYKSAHHFGRLIESYKFSQKEWPDLSGQTIKLLDDGRTDLRLVDIVAWDLEELKHECALRYMNLIVVDDNNKGSLRGVYISLDMDTDIIKHHLNFLWDISD